MGSKVWIDNDMAGYTLKDMKQFNAFGACYRLLIALFVGGIVFPMIAAGNEEGSPVMFSFQTYYLSDGEVGLAGLPPLFYRKGDHFLPVTLVPNKLGLKHTFQGIPPFALYVEEINEENQTVYRPVAVLRKTFASARPGPQLIVVKPVSGQLQVDAIPVGDEQLKPGQMLVLNAGDRDIAIRAGETEPVMIGRGSARIVDYLRDSDHRFRLLVASESGENGWELVYNSVLTQVREQPLLLVVYPHSGASHYNVRFIPLNR